MTNIELVNLRAALEAKRLELAARLRESQKGAEYRIRPAGTDLWDARSSSRRRGRSALDQDFDGPEAA